MANPVLNPTLYARVTGVALAAVAILGVILQIANDGAFVEGFLAFDWVHNSLHIGLAVLALLAGTVASGAYARNYARAFGVVYLGLAIAGFVSADAVGFLGIHLELGENLVHLLIGAWGIAAGFFSGTTTTTSSPRARGT